MHETNEGSSLNKSHANFGIETMPYDAVQYCTRTMQPTNAVMCKTDSTIILAGQIRKIINSENRENHQTQRPPKNRSGQIRNHRGAFKKWLIVSEIKNHIVPAFPLELFPLFLSNGSRFSSRPRLRSWVCCFGILSILELCLHCLSSTHITILLQ